MKAYILNLLNIKTSEAAVVKQLFLVQFFLGLATSFLITSALTLFLNTYHIKELPKVSLLAAGLLFIANYVYARLEAKLSAKKLLQVIILFSLISIAFTWVEALFLSIPGLPFFLSAWNLVLYMLVGYAFWGITAIIFNVRESKRIFSVVGSGDIPAKIIGYAAVAVLAPMIGVLNILLFSIVAFGTAYYFLNKFNYHGITTAPDHGHAHHQSKGDQPGFLEQVFHNKLILVIAVWSFIGFTIYSLIDFTFITEIKIKFKTSHELASFLGIFFAFGRVLAMFLKLLFSSRVINRIGLTNSLLITPAVLLLITAFILVSGNSVNTALLVFGMMVLFSEVLKSVVQEPAFFVLFQPLPPHARLRGHLITKGHTMPFALLSVGVFAFAFREPNGEISISLVCGTLVVLLLAWSGVVFLIKKEYLHTLIQALKKGYFTGTQLFLNDQSVREMLLAKIASGKPKEILVALELLERSDYKNLDTLLLEQLNSSSLLVKRFVLYRIIARNIIAALPIIRHELASVTNPDIEPDLIKALFYLTPELEEGLPDLKYVNQACKKAALLGLAARDAMPALNLVEKEVNSLAFSSQFADKLLALEVISEAPRSNFYASLKILLQDPDPLIIKKAIVVVGQVREYRLWQEVVTSTTQHSATSALQKAIGHFGDSIFSPEFIPTTPLPPPIKVAVIKTAGTITGSHSSNYLLQQLSTANNFKNEAIASLFYKKASIERVEASAIVNWVHYKLEQCLQKIKFYYQITTYPSVQLLAAALKSEIKQDLQSMLQAFALIYDRHHLERVLQLIFKNGDERISNAIEMLELSIPKKYFLQVDAIIEFLFDNNAIKIVTSPITKDQLAQVLKEIITALNTDYTVWTKSVAMYLIPAQKNKILNSILTEFQAEESNPLFSETKNFVKIQVEV